jgi:nucleotide-binding universal stress UspA family protein
MYAIHTILHPSDFSEYSSHALAVAGSLARDHGARLIVLHVAEPEVVVGESGILVPLPPGCREDTLERLRGLPLPDPNIRVEPLLEEGNPVEEILRTAEQTRCDLIVLGTHGRTGLRRLLVGSVAESVLRRARCPVLTVRGAATGADGEPHGAERQPISASAS